jgi:SPP1 gp7 family putative phage head morphogenesis protein
MSRSTFDQVDFRTKLESFTVAGNLTNNAIASIQNKAINAIEAGQSYKDFTSALSPEVLSNITSPSVVYQNAINNAYGRARFETQNDIRGVKPFLKYVTFGDEKVRPNHAILNGRVARADDDFWLVNYPPNGHNCRCVARALTEADVRRKGLQPRTMAQIEQDAAREQADQGIPVADRVRPLADPGWRGSFEVGKPFSDSLMKRLEKYNAPGYESFFTPDPVPPAIFKEPPVMKKNESFVATTKGDAENYARENFGTETMRVDYTGISVDSMNVINKALLEVKQKYNLQEVRVVEARTMKSTWGAFVQGKGLYLNRSHCFDEAAGRKFFTSGSGRYAESAVKANLKNAEDRIVFLQKKLDEIKAANPETWSKLTEAQSIRKYIKGYELDIVKYSNWWKRHNVGDDLKDLVVHETGHLLVNQKAPTVGMYGHYKRVPEFVFEGTKFQKYGFKRWMVSDEHRQFRRKHLSEYSEKNLNEYIAESFASYARGGAVHPEVKEFIEEILIK